MTEYEVLYYIDDSGRDVVQDWINSLKDIKGRSIIRRRLLRLGEGNFGENHYSRDGVWELVINYGPGYRIYYSISGTKVILLLCGGTKRGQNRDIETAVKFLRKFKEDLNLK